MSAKKFILKLLEYSIYIVLLLVFALNFRFVQVSGVSMLNTYHDKDLLLCVEYKNDSVKRGDIIVFHKENKADRYLIKRVIGLPGDKIKIQDNKVYVNGSILDEPYIKEEMQSVNYSETVVPVGSLFVLGDNRNYSLDSRKEQVGFVDINTEMLGIIIFDMSNIGVSSPRQIIFVLIILLVLIQSFDSIKYFITKRKEQSNKDGQT